MLLLLAIALLTLALSIFWYHQKKLPPGPWGLPFLGYLPWLDPKAPYLSFTTLARQYGPIYGVSLGNLYTVVLTDPKDIRSVLAKDASTGRAPLYVTHGIMKGYGKYKFQLLFIFCCVICKNLLQFLCGMPTHYSSFTGMPSEFVEPALSAPIHWVSVSGL